MNELKKYENVNKKAMEQFMRAAGQKEELNKRVEELQRNEQVNKRGNFAKKKFIIYRQLKIC